LLNRARRVSRDFLQRGGLWVLGQAVLLVAVTAGGPIWHGQWQSRPLITFCGLVLLIIAGGCGLAGAISLGRNLTPFPHPTVGARLVLTGVYGFIRHPLYTAVFSASVGWALIWGSWPALLAALTLGPFLNAKARREERQLRERFPEYASYEQRVCRFIPWIY
jgi:protein-S-isoprenylcysteine O-methyltransferase Ste14